LGATSVIITAAASQLAKMSIKLCIRDGITPICTVRKAEQVDQLKSEIEGLDYVLNTSEENFPQLMSETCKAEKPQVCLDSIGGP